MNTLADYYLKVVTGMVLVSGVLMVVMMIYTTGDVTGRYLANNPLPATYEFTVTLMVFIVFLSLAHTQAVGGHLKLDFLSQRINPRGQAILEILTLLIGLSLLALITWQAWGWAWEAWQIKEEMEGTLGIPYFPSRLGLTIGAFLLWIQYLINLIQRIDQLLRIGPQVVEGRQ